MKMTCIFCDTDPEPGDEYCAQCGKMLHDVRYGTLQAVHATDKVIRISRMGKGLKAAMGTVHKVFPDGTALVTWPHRLKSERIETAKLCLSFRTDSNGKLIW